MTFSKRLFLATAAACIFAAPAMAGDMIGNCEVSGAKGSMAIAAPAKAGQFTVGVSLPAPIWWNGDTPESIKDGMEYCMAAEIAWRAGFDKLEVVNLGWDAMIAGQTTGWDMAMSEISITEDRKKVHDFSISYFSSDIGVITSAAIPVDVKNLKAAKIGVQAGTTGAAFAVDKLGIAEPQTYPDQGEMFAALRSGAVETLFGDDLRIVYWLSGSASGGCCKALDGAYVDREFFSRNLAFLTRRDDQDLVQGLDYALDRLQEKGISGEVFSRYLPAGLW